MPFLGTLINFAAVLIFGILGTLTKRGIPQRISDAIMAAMAACVLYIGIDGIIGAAPAVSEGSFFSAGLVKVLIMILSMALGTLIGELADIDKHITALGDKLERKLAGGEESKGRFARGFVACSLLFCVGAMSVNGSIQDGLGNPDIILAKTVIDSISCFIMATTFGIGCAFSAFFLLLYQGAVAAIGFFLESVIPDATIAYMSFTGSLVIIFIATNMLKITKVKTANMIPAIFMPLVIAPIFDLFI